MNGDAVSATTEIMTMAARTPGSCRHARAPTRMRAQVVPVSSAAGRTGRRSAASAASIAPNETVLRANAQVYDPSSDGDAGEAGPTTRPRLNCAWPSDTAPSRSSEGRGRASSPNRRESRSR